MLGRLADILEKHGRGVCGAAFDFRECIHTFSLESQCCHPFWCFKNRPGVTRPVDSTFGRNCALQWLTSVSPGCCGRLLRNKEPVFITLLWFYLNIQLHFKPIMSSLLYNTSSGRLYSNTIHYVNKPPTNFGNFNSLNPFLFTFFFFPRFAHFYSSASFDLTWRDRNYIYISMQARTESSSIGGAVRIISDGIQTAVLSTARIVLTDVSAAHLSKRYWTFLECYTKWKFNQKLNFFNNFCYLLPVRLHVEQCSAALGSQSADRRIE